MAESTEDALEQPAESVSEIAELYLGNILYALELAAVSLEDRSKSQDAAFYRGIARKLANARGRTKRPAAGSAGVA